MQIKLPRGCGRVESGAVQFEGDWPGLFLRGDTAIAAAMSIRILQSRLAENDDAIIRSALSRLAKIADIIEQDVEVKSDNSKRE
jgi:hypothetical protein